MNKCCSIERIWCGCGLGWAGGHAFFWFKLLYIGLQNRTIQKFAIRHRSPFHKFCMCIYTIGRFSILLLSASWKQLQHPIIRVFIFFRCYESDKWQWNLCMNCVYRVHWETHKDIQQKDFARDFKCFSFYSLCQRWSE